MAGPGRSAVVSTRGRSVRAVVVTVCRCGTEYPSSTSPRERGGQITKHFECPPCELTSLQIVQRLATELEGTFVGLVLSRMCE